MGEKLSISAHFPQELDQRQGEKRHAEIAHGMNQVIGEAERDPGKRFFESKTKKKRLCRGLENPEGKSVQRCEGGVQNTRRAR